MQRFTTLKYYSEWQVEAFFLELFVDVVNGGFVVFFCKFIH
jgi:hypothetical protein